MHQVAYFNKKRKSQADHLGEPLPKHVCPDRSINTECNSFSSDNSKDLNLCVNEVKLNRPVTHYDDDQKSSKESNSYSGYASSFMSASNETETFLVYPKASLSDQPSTSSVNWSRNCSKSPLYSLESRSLTKSNSDKTESLHIGVEQDYLLDNFGSLSTQILEDYLVDFADHFNSTCSGYTNDKTEQYLENEFEMLYSNGVIPSYVLSSGTWTADQGAPEGRKLTIDKEFEQYFSSMML